MSFYRIFPTFPYKKLYVLLCIYCAFVMFFFQIYKMPLHHTDVINILLCNLSYQEIIDYLSFEELVVFCINLSWDQKVETISGKLTRI